MELNNKGVFLVIIFIITIFKNSGRLDLISLTHITCMAIKVVFKRMNNFFYKHFFVFSTFRTILKIRNISSIFHSSGALVKEVWPPCSQSSTTGKLPSGGHNPHILQFITKIYWISLKFHWTSKIENLSASPLKCTNPQAM